MDTHNAIDRTKSHSIPMRPFIDLGHSHGATLGRHQLEKLRTVDTYDILPYLRPISRLFLRDIILAAFEENRDYIVDRYHNRVHYRHTGWVAVDAYTGPRSQTYDSGELRSFALKSISNGMRTAIFAHTGEEQNPSYIHLEGCNVLLLCGNGLIQLLKEGHAPVLPAENGSIPSQTTYRNSCPRRLRAQLLGS